LGCFVIEALIILFNDCICFLSSPIFQLYRIIVSHLSHFVVTSIYPDAREHTNVLFRSTTYLINIDRKLLGSRVISHKLLVFGPLPIRILAGTIFLAHGLPKLENIAKTQGLFGSIGLSPELALLIGLLEVIGGIFLVVGVVTRISAGLLIIDMIGAINLVKLTDGFVGGYEFELLLISIAVSLLLTGPGRISIEWDVLKREIFPRGRTLVQNQKDAVKKCEVIYQAF
jgi:putative oxidoreductase